MEQAKAIINLQEGVIHLEGPVEFVRHYLDMYRSSIKGLQGTPEGVTASRERQTSAGRRRRRTKPVSCATAVHEEFEAGFFAEPKSIRETNQRLIENGMTCTDNSIGLTLKRLYGKDLLDRVKKGRTFRYRRKT